MPREVRERVECPYCGLTNWSRVQIIHKSVESTVHLCKCSHCGRIFLLYRTRLRTFTIELESVDIPIDSVIFK